MAHNAHNTVPNIVPINMAPNAKKPAAALLIIKSGSNNPGYGRFQTRSARYPYPAKDKNANGYVVYRATKKNGKYAAVKTINKGKTVTFTNKNLKKGKTYYYKIKAYKKVNGKKALGQFSAVKSVKIKK